MRRGMLYSVACVIISSIMFISCQGNIGETVEVNVSKADSYIRGLLPLADTGRIYCGSGSGRPQYHIYAEITPNQQTKADTLYEIELYEDGIMRSSWQERWNKPEINIRKTKIASFPASISEGQAYNVPEEGATIGDIMMGVAAKDLRGIFSVKVRYAGK